MLFTASGRSTFHAAPLSPLPRPSRKRFVPIAPSAMTTSFCSKSWLSRLLICFPQWIELRLCHCSEEMLRRSLVQRGLSLNGQLGSIMMRGMVIDMNDEQLHTRAELQDFLDGTVAVD